MKIVLSAPTNPNPANTEFLNEAERFLKKEGHNVFRTQNDASGKNKLENIFLKNDKLIKECDIFIVELSSTDSKIGFEIARALEEKKVVLCFENDKNQEEIVFHGNDKKQLILKKYAKSSISKNLSDGIKDAERKLDSKFILIISPEMDRYLNWASKEKRTHKAQIVRTAVEQMIKKDKDYRKYNE